MDSITSMVLSGLILLVVLKLVIDGFEVLFPSLRIVQRLNSFCASPFALLRELRLTRYLHHPYLQILGLFLATRLILVIGAALSYALLEDKPLALFENFRAIWDRWDTRHYLLIAEHWYPTEGSEVVLLVFYPMFPLLIRAAEFFIGDYFLSAVIVSNVCLLGACGFLYKLMQHEFNNHQAAIRAVLLLLVFPYSYYTSIGYTEGAFIFFSIASFYFIRRESWLLAGLFGLAAAFTRNQGILLFGPMLYELVRTHIHYFRSGIHLPPLKIVLRYASCLLIPVGTVLYLSINKDISGDWFKFLQYQEAHWGQRAMWFADNIVSIASRFDFSSPRLTIGTWLPSVAFFTFFLACIVWLACKMPTVYGVYSVAFFVISYSPSWLLSGPRYVFVIFPVYMLLAKLLENRPMTTAVCVHLFSFVSLITVLAFLRGTVY